MKLLDLTLPTPAENLALDEALLEEADAGIGPERVLRLWESPEPAVILGRSCRYREETHWDACVAAGVPVLRRPSGGGTVVIGPGCLMYTVLLPYDAYPRLAMIEVAHEFVLSRVQVAVETLATGVEIRGTSDLAVDGRKFSGNSLRCKRAHLLYHGTLLYNFPLDAVTRWLAPPPRQPDYRAGRTHGDFVRNLPLDPARLRAALADAWQAHEPLDAWPKELTRRLVADRYSRDAWNQRI
ncbi:MAG: biotin/lipoate A/B protein ligase family protein [Planctomycetota bacterium]